MLNVLLKVNNMRRWDDACNLIHKYEVEQHATVGFNVEKSVLVLKPSRMLGLDSECILESIMLKLSSMLRLFLQCNDKYGVIQSAVQSPN